MHNPNNLKPKSTELFVKQLWPVTHM